MQRLRSGDRRRALALQRGAGWRGLAARQGVERRLGRGSVEILVEIVVDLDDRRVDAGAEALDFGEREFAVRGGLADADAEFLAACLDDLVGAAQPARRRRADLEEMLADRLEVEHRVEGRDLVDPHPRHAEEIGHRVHGGAWQPIAALALREVEQRQHRARLAAGRIFGDMRLGLGEILRRVGKARGLRDRGAVGVCAHRSILPKTMSIEPMMATTSASKWPFDMKSTPCRKAKSGARILQRYGLLLPSETR